MCTAAFSAAQPGPPLVVSPCCHPIQFATLRVFVLKMHNFTVCTDILLIWMAAVRAIPQTLVALGVLSCTAPHSHAASKIWNISQSLSLEKEKKEKKKNSLNWRHVQISHSSHGVKHSESAAPSLSSSSSSWPLASYQPLMACGCKCEVWRFVKVRDSESVYLWDWGGGDHCQLTGPSLLSLFKGFVKAAALSHPHWQKPALSPQIKLDP